MGKGRDFGGPDDLRRMQTLVERVWRAAGGPPVSHHVGDLPWRLFSVPGAAERFRIRVWQEGDEVVAWGWLTLPDELELVIAPGRLEQLLEPIVQWANDTAGQEVKVDALDSDVELRRLLEARGHVLLADDEEFVTHTLPLERLAEPAAPAPYRLRHVVLPEDLERRVEVHRSAFGRPERPSRVTSETYATVATSWPYRQELDWVAEAADGSFAAFCLVWLDEENRVGELEPVGTHPTHRRRGLASAVCLAALHAVRAAGAETAVVCAVTDEARALYRSIGFQEVARYAWFGRRVASAPS